MFCQRLQVPVPSHVWYTHANIYANDLKRTAWREQADGDPQRVETRRPDGTFDDAFLRLAFSLLCRYDVSMGGGYHAAMPSACFDALQQHMVRLGCLGVCCGACLRMATRSGGSGR